MFVIPVGISGRHVHLSQQTLDILFGVKDYKLTFFKPLKQTGQFAAQEKIDILSPTGKILPQVRILGPVRSSDQVEISQSDALRHGFIAPVRESGDLKGTGKATLIGPKGQVDIQEGVIIANRHIHFSTQDAQVFGVKDKQMVAVKVAGTKPGTLEQVLCRVHPDFVLECHLDTDDASAFLLKTGDQVTLIK
ncbi:Putative propanediol utilization protein [Candidatus Phytoplasma australiense]|uniref:Phosphate propanoyltransferase n=2 Tax=Phytoplasma australiense TaxID=59748 RepID=B1V9I7_PHYAS|nr:phosphate propanoyltransferase [Candidatus Phytoplasma australiense]AGL90070.1 Propanediol Utilization Protein [Strawberry lethal yellows phytoplasma (CPA) str. NZSb11]CAM11609.1 Putative propanediol utilization protein [Candidatus Phytoplasma australiense]